MTQPAKITLSSLTQSPSDPSVLSDWALAFTLDTPVPTTAALQLTAPVGVSFSPDPTACTVTTNTFKTSLCRFNGNSVIQIRNAFADARDNYRGDVIVSFNAYNPPDNLQKTQSLKLEVFTDASFQYLIAVTSGGLDPRTSCNYPCLTCDSANPNQCLSCVQSPSDPPFLMTDTSGASTCKYSCDLGYTFSKSKKCVKCNERCATCLSTETQQDADICTKCSPTFPYFWQDTNQCLDAVTKCPAGTYQFSKYVCASCPKNCLACTSPYNCLKCDPTGPAAFRQSGQCTRQCPSGRTPVMIQGAYEC